MPAQWCEPILAAFNDERTCPPPFAVIDNGAGGAPRVQFSDPRTAAILGTKGDKIEVPQVLPLVWLHFLVWALAGRFLYEKFVLWKEGWPRTTASWWRKYLEPGSGPEVSSEPHGTVETLRRGGLDQARGCR